MKKLMTLFYQKARRNRSASYIKNRITALPITLRMIHPQKTILLTGCGRSGTTWLGNIIAACRGFGSVFEPFDYRKVPQAGDLPLHAYLRPQGNYPQYKPFIEHVLGARIHNAWIDMENCKIVRWRYLVKAIRANMMLAWIDRTFHCPIVYMVRHPCAVVLSNTKLNWEAHLDILLSQPELVEDYLAPFESIIREAKTPIQEHAIAWCVENMVPLRQFADHDWVFCTYEELCRDAESEVNRIFARLGLKRTKRVDQAVGRPSRQTRFDSAIRMDKDPVSDWQNHLTKKEISEILAIVSEFGIELYGEEVMPVHSYVRRLRGDTES